MKHFTYFCTVILFAALVELSTSCDTTLDCEINQCCKDFHLFKRCVNLSNLGEKCGGTFLCGCARGLMCQRHEDTIGNKLKIGVGNCVPYIDLPKN